MNILGSGAELYAGDADNAGSGSEEVRASFGTSSPRDRGGLWATKWICAIAIGGSGLLSILAKTGGLFAAGSLIKAIALPLVYLVLLVCALQARKAAPSVPQPGYMIWSPVLLCVLMIATLSAIIQGDHLSVMALSQDLVMLCAMSFAAIAALHLSQSSIQKILQLITLTGLFLATLGATLPPFTSLTVPALFSAFLLRRQYSDSRVWKCAPWVGCLLVLRSHLATGTLELSGAITLQYIACAGVLLLIVTIRHLRMPFFACLGLAALSVGSVVLFTQPGQQLSGMGGDVDDITIEQRLYEMAAVQEAIGASSISRFAGLGPGSTVALYGSPDNATLQASGRNLGAVDDVHLLTADLLLKMGLAGLLWLAVVFGCLIAAIWNVAQRSKEDRVSVGLVIFLAGMLAYGAPAATNFLANPLFGFFFGLLVSNGIGKDLRSAP